MVVAILGDNFRDFFQQTSFQIFMGFIQQFCHQRVNFRLHVCCRIRVPGRRRRCYGGQGIGAGWRPEQRGIKGGSSGGRLDSVEREIGLGRLAERVVFVIRPDVQFRFAVMALSTPGRIQKRRIVVLCWVSREDRRRCRRSSGAG